jgi:hypothetical protein
MKRCPQFAPVFSILNDPTTVPFSSKGVRRQRVVCNCICFCESSSLGQDQAKRDPYLRCINAASARECRGLDRTASVDVMSCEMLRRGAFKGCPQVSCVFCIFIGTTIVPFSKESGDGGLPAKVSVLSNSSSGEGEEEMTLTGGRGSGVCAQIGLDTWRQRKQSGGRR